MLLVRSSFRCLFDLPFVVCLFVCSSFCLSCLSFDTCLVCFCYLFGLPLLFLIGRISLFVCPAFYCLFGLSVLVCLIALLWSAGSFFSCLFDLPCVVCLIFFLLFVWSPLCLFGLHFVICLVFLVLLIVSGAVSVVPPAPHRCFADCFLSGSSLRQLGVNYLLLGLLISTCLFLCLFLAI